MSLQDVEIQNMLFLASMTALGVGCDAPDSNAPMPFTTAPASASAGGTGDNDDGATNNNDGDGGDTDGGADNADGAMDGPTPTGGPNDGNGDGPMDADDGTTGGPADGTVDADAGDTYGEYGSEESGEMAVVGMTCQAYADILTECYDYTPKYTEAAAQFCQLDINDYTQEDPACAMALEEYYACIGMQTCRTLKGNNCQIDMMACPNAGGGGGGEDGG